MSLPCPHCQHTMKIKGIKPGRFEPKCSKCGRTFTVVITEKEGKLQCSIRKTTEKAQPGTPGSGTEEKGTAPNAPLSTESPPVAQVPEARSEKASEGSESLDKTLCMPEPTSGSQSEGGQKKEKQSDASFEVDDPQKPPVRQSLGQVIGKEKPDKHLVLGGYEVTQQLGKGGMGTVYLARQISLDRPVALKVMNPKWASDPTFLARFIREAYAAAQLVHHHIVQIYDIGNQNGIHYFSMELVKGQALSALVKQTGKLDVEEATSYILQAARGLSYAHQRGMIHRDVKPDNLLLNDQGVVKVADLGLVKTPGVEDPVHAQTESSGDQSGMRSSVLSEVSDVTRVGLAVGTPAYMPPEQWQSAATVDARADIYSLGCTWYALLTGRPPFKGESAMEVMTRHLEEQPISPETIVNRIPQEVTNVLMRMIAKRPEDRPQSMAEVITDLEQLLGIQQSGAFSPTEEQVQILESSVKQFNEAPAARLRSLTVPGFLASCGILTVLCSFFSLRLAGGILGLGLLTLLFTALIQGFTARAYLFIRFREYLLGSRWGDWATWGMGALIALILLHLSGLLTYWLGFAIVAATLAGGYHFMITRPLIRQREGAIQQAEQLLKQLRLRGISEEGAQQFVCKYGGAKREEFFEALYGYEQMLYARSHWTLIGSERHQVYATWRDPIIRWLNAQQQLRKQRKEEAHLKQIEQQGLEAQGVKEAEAKGRAEEAAQAMVQVAAEMREEPQPLEETEATMRSPLAANAQLMLKAASQPTELPPKLKRAARGRGARQVARSLLGGKARFLAGAFLLAASALWLHHNDLVSGQNLSWESFKLKLHMAKPLGILPGPLGDLLSGFNPGAAGLLLVVSAFTKSRRLIFFLLLGAFTAFMGHYVGIKDLGPFTAPYVSLLAGLAIAEFGIVFNRMTRPEPSV